MTFPSAWIVGSIVLETSADITVGGVPVTIPAGEYYLDDPTASLSLVAQVLAAVSPEMTAAAVFIGRDRRLRITDSVAFTWTAIDSRLQLALGLGATVGPTSSATATAISELLWSPAYCATTTGHPDASAGWEVPQRAHSTSPSGLTQQVTVHGTSQVRCALSWAQVLRDRAWTAGEDDGAPGDYRRFWRVVLLPGRRWKWYPDVVEGSSPDSAPAVLVDPKGPYIAQNLPEPWWSRSVPNADTHSDISLEGTLTAEIS